jgi:hypothetical protein
VITDSVKEALHAQRPAPTALALEPSKFWAPTLPSLATAWTTSTLITSERSSIMATTSPYHFRLIVEAFDDYANKAGEDLTKNPLADALRACDSPNAVLELLQEKAQAFKDYRDGDHKLISWLKPVVQVVQGFSGILGEAISFVSRIRRFFVVFSFTSFIYHY